METVESDSDAFEESERCRAPPLALPSELVAMQLEMVEPDSDAVEESRNMAPPLA